VRGASRGVREGEGGKVFGICVAGISGKRFFVRRIENMILSRRFLRTAALAASAWSAGTALASVPVAWWSTSQIAQIAIVLACGIGAAGCLWHLASAGLALAILLRDAVAITSQASQASTTSRTSRGASCPA